MGQFSVEKLVLPGSALSGNQQTLAIYEDYALILRAEVEQRNGRQFELGERKAVTAGAPAHPRG